jgi:hypothetical protein
MTSKEHNRRCARWVVAYIEALTHGRKVYMLRTQQEMPCRSVPLQQTLFTSH